MSRLVVLGGNEQAPKAHGTQFRTIYAAQLFRTSADKLSACKKQKIASARGQRVRVREPCRPASLHTRYTII